MQTWDIRAKEPEYSIWHLWENISTDEVSMIAIGLSMKNWREIQITPKQEM